ncbi:putative flippase GtrA (transmembrane translocase of bactoprenol-linked glucose) [Williamsia maris]|uniref:Flippase GtrA (Transmembrane translocase of bactoprenol-linked glucose) n=1 Tax=Williamsia maris TaxID=72806 RepID=A0ABT1HBD0_9NOCA|nr:putative flippase GtrA (transmembrane translocase of bactoprenol-linked glucose) [Williamsia maris]
MRDSFVHSGLVSFIDGLMARTPAPVQRLALRHHELIKFALVGGSTMIFDMAIFYSLSLSVLEQKPVVAKVIASTLATVLSYFLNREWAFKNRGGRQTHHEVLLFFVISGMGVILQAAPLFIANNLFDVRNHASVAQLVVIDFVLGYVIGNVLQLAFRFWALRKFAFPETQGHEDQEIEALATGHVTLPENKPASQSDSVS